MRYLLFLAPLLVACQGPTIMKLADGTQITVAGHLGGKNTTLFKRTPSGGISFASKSDNTESFRDGSQAGLAATGLIQAGLSNRATTTSDTVKTVSANNAAIQKADIAAGVKKAEIAAGVTKALEVQ